MAYLGHIDGYACGIYDACNKICDERKLNPLIIYDLGARHGEGYHSFGQRYPAAKYVFVEPSDRCIDDLHKTMNEYSDRRIDHVHGVLGVYSEKRKFFVLENDNDQSGNLFSERNGVYGTAKICEVNVVPYSSIDLKIDFCKVNVEGHEYELIDDGFFNRVKTFVMEAHNQHVPDKTYKDALNALSDKFDMFTFGNVLYKYCFIVGWKR